MTYSRPKKLLVNYNQIKEALKGTPKTLTELENELHHGLAYLHIEIQELVSLNKVQQIKHDGGLYLYWTDTVPKFEHELKNNVIYLDKVLIQYICSLTSKRQLKLPKFVFDAMNEKIKNMNPEDTELIVEIKAVNSKGTWYSIKQK